MQAPIFLRNPPGFHGPTSNSRPLLACNICQAGPKLSVGDGNAASFKRHRVLLGRTEREIIAQCAGSFMASLSSSGCLLCEKQRLGIYKILLNVGSFPCTQDQVLWHCPSGEAGQVSSINATAITSFFTAIHLQALMENILASKAQLYNNYCEYFIRSKADY